MENAKSDSNPIHYTEVMMKLKDARKSNKIKLISIANQLGVDKSVISKLENSNKDIQIGTLIKYIRAMNGNLTFSITIGKSTRDFDFC